MSKRPTHPTFIVDDLVAWTSKVGGTAIAKRGRVVKVIQTGDVPEKTDLSHIAGRSRSHPSYIIEVELPPSVTRDSESPTRKVRYWPHVSALTLVGHGKPRS